MLDYDKLQDRFGAGARAAGWGGPESQHKRFDVLLDGIREAGSVLDVGCSDGALWKRIKMHWSPEVNYTGIDQSQKAVDAAKDVYGDKFQCVDLGDYRQKHDWVIASGLFGDRAKEGWPYMEQSLYQMWELAEKGILFNFLSAWGGGWDEGEEDFLYVDPAKLIVWCRVALTRKVVLRHDYMNHDATLYLYK